MNIFGPGMWGGLADASGTYLRQANLMDQQQEQARRFDETQKIREAQELRQQAAFEQQRKQREAQNIFGRAILTGQVPDLMGDLKTYAQGSGPLADINPDVQALTEAMPLGMIKGYMGGDYMPYEEKLGWEMQKYQLTHPQKNNVTLKEMVGPEGLGVYAYNRDSGQMDKLGAPAPKSGESIRVNPKTGEIEIVRGPGAGGRNASDIARGTQNSVQRQFMDSTADIDQAETLYNNFQRKFLERGYRAEQALNSVLDAWIKGSLSPQKQKELGEYTDYITRASTNLNNVIHRLSGAAVSEHEETRLKSGIPNPGEHWWAGDSPTEFLSKLKTSIQLARLAQARWNYFLRKGLNVSELGGKALARKMPLTGMKQIIKDKTKEFLQALVKANPGADPQKLLPQARQKASEFFGVRI